MRVKEGIKTKVKSDEKPGREKQIERERGAFTVRAEGDFIQAAIKRFLKVFPLRVKPLQPNQRKRDGAWKTLCLH